MAAVQGIFSGNRILTLQSLRSYLLLHRSNPASRLLGWLGLVCAALLLSACNPASMLTDDNLVRGARAETFLLGHGALCARLPSTEAIDLYSRELVPESSAVGRNVKSWDLSGLLDIFQTQDGRWVVLPSEGLKKLNGVHFRKGPSGENDALCFGRLWIERLIEYRKNKPMGLDDAVTARFEATLKDPQMLKYFRNLKVEPFDPNLFTLTQGVAYAETLSPSFVVDIALRPTPNGWFLANGAFPK